MVSSLHATTANAITHAATDTIAHTCTHATAHTSTSDDHANAQSHDDNDDGDDVDVGDKHTSDNRSKRTVWLRRGLRRRWRHKC